MYIIIALIGFSLLIIVHELGHFIMAKINKIKVEEFSIGMGPTIFSINGKETVYSLKMFPIGGYVKMLGEDNNSDNIRSFSKQTPMRKISVILAGVTMNIIFAIVALSIVMFNRGFYELKISSIDKNSPAAHAGLKVEDTIIKVNGDYVFTPTDVLLDIQFSNGKVLNLLVNRNGEKKEVIIEPKLEGVNGDYKYILGYHYNLNDKPKISQSFKQSINEILSILNQTFKSVKMIVMGELSFRDNVGGPITIIKISSQAAKNGIMTLIYFLGFISLNLAVFNLIPFPALDGGWTAIILIEIITRRKIPDKIIGMINYFGFIVLMGLMILVVLKDILFPINI